MSDASENKYHLIVDFEVDKFQKRMAWIFPRKTSSFDEALKEFKRENPGVEKTVVQYVDAITGDTVKGPKYDSATMPLHSIYTVERLLNGVKQKPPHEPSHVEPRDRIQENNQMNKPNILQSLIQECISEIRSEKIDSKKAQLKEALRGPVREVLKEIASAGKGVKPEKEEAEKIDKGYNKKGNEILDKTNEKQCKELESIVHSINSDWDVYWDDHNQLVVHAENLLSIRICPKFENNFDIDFMVKLLDRVRVIAVDWETVKSTVKANLTNLAKDSIAHQKQADQVKTSSSEGEKGKDAGPRHDITKEKKVSDTKKDNKDYNEKEVSKDEDQPSAPMKDVGDKKGLNKDIEKTSQVKPPKHKTIEGSEKLRIALGATKKHRAKKS